VFGACKQVADLGDVPTEKEGFSIVDTRVPAIATPRIRLAGHHQGECQLLLPGLDFTWILARMVSSGSDDDCLPSASVRNDDSLTQGGVTFG